MLLLLEIKATNEQSQKANRGGQDARWNYLLRSMPAITQRPSVLEQ